MKKDTPDGHKVLGLLRLRQLFTVERTWGMSFGCFKLSYIHENLS